MSKAKKPETVKFDMQVSASYKDWRVQHTGEDGEDTLCNMELQIQDGDYLGVSLADLRDLQILLEEYFDRISA